MARMFTLALSSLLLAGTLAHAADNDFTRPIRFISAMAPGGSGDLNARRLADALRQRIGNSVVVENRADRKSTRLNSSHIPLSRMPSSA